MNVHLIKSHKDQFQRIADAIARANDLEATDQVVIDTAEGETGLFDIIDKAVAQIEQNEAWADVLGEKIRALSERQLRFSHAASDLREAVAEAMIEIGKPSHKTPEFTLSVRVTKPKMLINEETLPDDYKKTVIKKVPDKDAIQAVLDIGGDVPGVTKTNGKPSLTVRVR